jgi:hypothetical protein
MIKQALNFILLDRMLVVRLLEQIQSLEKFVWKELIG